MLYKFIEKLNKIKNHPYYYISPLVYSIGDACEQITISSTKIRDKKIIILFPFIFKNFFRYKICNKSLFKNLNINSLEGKKSILITVINYLLNIEFFFRRLKFLYLSKIIGIKKTEYDSFPYVGIHSHYHKNFIKKKFQDIKPLDVSNLDISLDEKKNFFCEKILKNKKIPYENIVCLHVRDSGYKNDFGKKSYRNSDINNYIALIKYLISKNYFVVRMGNNTAKKINFSDKNFFDYAHSEINSSLMDLYLIKKCKFFVATQSGIMDTAYMFNKPTLITNMNEIFCSYPLKINDRGLFKKIKMKDKDKNLNLLDYINMNYSKHNPENKICDFEFIENSSEDLFNAIVEFENLYKFKNYNLSKNQIKINEIVKKRFNESIYEDITNVSDTFDKLENAKVAFWVKSCKGSLCETYLKSIF
jgi:putative glycosyltransferase (TIGR04372 family)